MASQPCCNTGCKRKSCPGSLVWEPPDSMSNCVNTSGYTNRSHADVKTWPNDPCNKKKTPEACRKDLATTTGKKPPPNPNKVRIGWPPKEIPEPFLSYTTLDNDDPRKYHISGYGGFVPRIMNKFGTFSIMTRNGMNEFSDANEQNKRIVDNTAVCSRTGG